ncbi:MAG TPA: PaaI family thioesterase [Solirubrobacteraceae bacterium]|nr:PaaI family thioesterase [Solirubrobacteraceae bacterium]
MAVPPPIDAQGFDALYGLELTECSGELARGRLEVRDELKQPGGPVHGGIYGAIADALAVRGTAAAVSGENRLAIGLANQITVLHPFESGTVFGTATCRHRGRTTWVWEIELADDAGRVCVSGRVTVSVRDAQRG